MFLTIASFTCNYTFAPGFDPFQVGLSWAYKIGNEHLNAKT